MKNILLYICLLWFSINCLATENDSLVSTEPISFSSALKENFKKYVNLSNKAYNKKNYEQIVLMNASNMISVVKCVSYYCFHD